MEGYKTVLAVFQKQKNVLPYQIHKMGILLLNLY